MFKFLERFKKDKKPCCEGNRCDCEPKAIPEEDQIPPNTIPETLEPDTMPEEVPEDKKG